MTKYKRDKIAKKKARKERQRQNKRTQGDAFKWNLIEDLPRIICN